MGFFIIAIIVIGVSAGWLASLIYGKANDLSWAEMMIIGLLGSVTGGLLINAIQGNGLEFQITGMIGAAAGALVVLPIFVWLRGMSRKRKGEE